MPSMASSHGYSASELKAWIVSVFMACGVPRNDATETARILVRTSLRGIDTHGLARVSLYVDKLLSGEVTKVARPVLDTRDGVLFCDGDGGLGQVVASRAVEAIVDRVRETAVAVCFIKRSGHLAALGQFVLEAAERGMIAVMCQETPPLMAMPGSGSAAIGNNPLAFAAPVADGPPLVFDMATSVVARGNVVQAARDKQQAIPEGWAIGPDGEPTTDPATALRGAMLPISGHKGVGLAMLVQVLAGSLTASVTAQSARTHSATGSAGNVSAFLMAINPDRVIGRKAFDDHMADWLKTYLTACGPSGRYPGQRAAAVEAVRNTSGIPLSPGLIAELRQAGARLGVPFGLGPIQPDRHVPSLVER